MNKEMNQKKYIKHYIEETLKSRKYFSYRLDLILIKTIITIIFFLLIYSRTLSLIFSILISAQIFLMITLINKKILSNRQRRGKKLVFDRIRKNIFIEKIYNMTKTEFDKYVKLILKKSGYLKIEKEEKELFSGYINNNKIAIKIFYMYEGAKVELSDIRDFIIEALDLNYKYALIVSPHIINEKALENIEILQNKINIEIYNQEKLYSITNDFGLLPDNDDLYYKLADFKPVRKKTKIIKTNIFGLNKIIIYSLSALFFYLTGKITYFNTYNTYISYYFIILVVITIIYNIKKGSFKKSGGESENNLN